MLSSTREKLVPELMDVVRLFEGAEELEIAHDMKRENGFENVFTLGGREYRYVDKDEAKTPLEEKSLEKRYAKLSLYRLLSEYYGKRLPWGSLTGIRPTRLAYRERERTGDFRPMFSKLGVSEENTELVARVLAAQEGILGGEGIDLYVSIPFCPSKCVYCSFITAPIEKTRAYLPAYLDALERELEASRFAMGNIRSVYVGGGTPFVLDPPDLERVLRAAAPFARGAEFTVEAGRPDVFSREKLDLCKAYGVTRICVNAQSFSDRTLQAIGRRHTAADVYEAFEMTRDYPFDVNCDLIAGLTGETLEEFCGSVDAAVALSPENVTVHTLCLKRGARLKEERLEKGGAVRPLDGGVLADMIAYSRRTLTAAGYEPYYLYRQKYMAGAHENVGWSKRGHACVYNIDVMEETCDNLAVGANAVTKRVFLGEGRIERYGSPKDIPTYIQKLDVIVGEKNKLFR